MAQQTLTDGAAITWDFNSGANAKVTIAGARTLVITNMEAGDTGLILVKQDAAGGRTLTLPGSSSIVGGGSYTASSAANATDVLGVYYDGTTYWWTIGYNTVTPPLTSVGITGSDFVIANSPLTSNGNIGLTLATVNSNVGTFGSATAVPVVTVNAKGLITAVSTTNISIPTNLDSLTDVTISSAATGQLLQFNGSQWVNWTPNYLTGITSSQVTTALGYTPVPTTRTLSINGTSYDLSANRAWTIDTVSYVSRVQHGVKAAVAINKGQAVYVTSADGTNMIVSLASNASEATSSKTMGLLDATVAINGMANVVTEGLLAGLDTSLAGQEGDPVWLGDNGNLIYGLPNKPYAPRHLVFIGIVTRKNQNTGEIFVKVQNGFELKEIHDVDLITTVPVDGHILGYNGTLWVNKTIASWLGFTPANDANVVHTTGNESIAGIKTFSGTTQATSTSTGTIVTAGGVGIAKNLYVGGDINVVGNLIIGGTTTTVYAQNLTVSDNMIYLNNGIATTITNAVGNGSSVVYTTQETHNYIIGMSVTITSVSPTAYNLSNQIITGVSTNSFTIANSATGSYSSGGTARAKSNANPDLGFAAGYNDGSYAHAGLFRDATDNTWKFFKGYTPEPDASPFIDTSHASFAYADLRADNITGRSFIKVGGVSSEFLKADGSVDSNTYLTTGTASSSYQPLDGDLTAISGLTATGFLKRTGTNTWTLDSNVYLTGITSSDVTTALGYTPVPTTRILTINGTSYDLSANRSWTITAGVSSVSAGSGIAVNTTTGAVTVTNTGLLSATAGSGIAVSTTSGALSIANTGLLSAVAGSGIAVSTTSGALSIANTGLLSATAGSGIAVSTSSGALSIANTGLLSAVAGSGISVSTSSGVLSIANTITNLSQLTNGPGYITGYTETDTLASVTGRGATTNTAVTFNGNVTLGNAADLIFKDLAGTFPTSGKGFDWELNNDGARIYAIQPSSDSIDLVFQLRDNATTNDRFVFWVDDYQGPAFDKYPLIIRGGTEFDLVSSSLYTNGTLRLSNAGVLQNVTGNISMFTNNSLYITTDGRAYPRRSDGTNIDFTYSAQSGQPTYLWGTNNGTTMYVYNPSNFSVNYASSAGSASTAGYATEAKWISFEDGPRDLSDRRPNWNNRSVAWDFVTAGTADGVGNYAGVMTFSPWDGTSASTGDSSYQLAFINENGVNASGIPGLRLRNGIDSTWNNWYQVWHSGNFTNNSSNWNTAYSKRPTALSFSGTGTKTLTLTLGDSSTLTASFSDIDTNTDAQTLSLSGSTLSISGGNSITLPTGGISQGTADSLYVNVSGDEMTGNLYISPISANPAQIQLAGTNPELYVSAKTGTARVFINREGSGHQATLMFTTGMNVFQGTAWDYTGIPMWSMGMTNNNNVNSFKLAYGDIYEPTSVALEITTANVAYFKNVPYAAGNLLATQAWVTSQGYLTALPSHNHDDRYYTESEIDSQISNRLYQARVSGLDFNAFNGTGLYRGSTSGWTNRPLSQHNGGALLQIDTHPGDYHSQLYFDTGADRLYFRNANSGSWGSWLVMLHSSNIGSYAWTSSNDGAGSGLDADLLDGYNSDTVANVNTIVRRDSSGNIYSNYVLGTYFNASQGNSENPTIGQIWTQNTSDNYLRKSTPGHFRSQITDAYYLSSTGGTVSGNVNLTGQLAFLDGNNGFSNIIRSAAYPSEGYPDGVNYWMEYRAYGGHHFVLNVDGGVNSGANTMDDFVVWQGAIDGNKLLEVSNTGTLTIADRLIELSSIRYKTNVESLTPALDKVLQLRPVYYTKIGGTGSTEIGLIAEEVAEIYPELIKYDDVGQVDGINYTRIAPILIKTIQEQQELIKNLTKRIDDLENR
jgi:hypothetical protein